MPTPGHQSCQGTSASRVSHLMACGTSASSLRRGTWCRDPGQGQAESMHSQTVSTAAPRDTWRSPGCRMGHPSHPAAWPGEEEGATEKEPV